jgi:hypothetical protein
MFDFNPLVRAIILLSTWVVLLASIILVPPGLPTWIASIVWLAFTCLLCDDLADIQIEVYRRTHDLQPTDCSVCGHHWEICNCHGNQD